LKIFRFSLTHRTFRFLAKILAANFTPEGDIKIPAGIFEIYRNPQNEPVFQAIEDNPDRFLGWVFVNPRGDTDQVQELNKWKDNAGFVGVKAHPFWHRYPPAELLPVAVELARTGKPLLIHAGFDAHGEYDVLLREVPDLKLVLAHAGFPLYADTWKKIRNNKNVYVDLSQSIYLNAHTTRQAVENLGAERVLFGTDGPYGVHGDDDLFDYAFLKRRIEGLFPDKATQKKILGENFMEIAAL
jgi:predicted TIM-barrel fold metal-dependent hydrolase